MMSADMFAMCVLFSGLAAEMKVAGASKTSEEAAAVFAFALSVSYVSKHCARDSQLLLT